MKPTVGHLWCPECRDTFVHDAEHLQVLTRITLEQPNARPHLRSCVAWYSRPSKRRSSYGQQGRR